MKFLTKVSKLPGHPKEDFHYWADYIEVLCLINADGIISQIDFIDRVKTKSRDLEDADDSDQKKPGSDVNEKFNLFAEDCFNIIEYRTNAFGAYYPFVLSDDKKNIHFVKEITLQQKLYLSLLFSSTLNYFGEFKAGLTSSFERLSLEVLQNLLPIANSNSYIVGSSNIEELMDENEQASTFWDKINELAVNIREHVVIKREKISKYNKGDGGLDVVGWVGLGDSNPHIPLYFGQCACTPEWNKKQNSSKADRWGNFINLTTNPLNLIFIPYSFRSGNGEWHKGYLIEKSILMDRERLIKNFKTKEETFSQFEAFKIVNEILESKESVV